MNGLQVGDRTIRVSLAKVNPPKEGSAGPLQPLNDILPQSGISVQNRTKRPHQDPDKVARTVYLETIGEEMDEQVSYSCTHFYRTSTSCACSMQFHLPYGCMRTMECTPHARRLGGGVRACHCVSYASQLDSVNCKRMQQLLQHRVRQSHDDYTC